MNILIIFTYDVSLKNWHDQDFFREISLYKELEKADKNLRFTLTFGDKNDYEIQKVKQSRKLYCNPNI